MRIGHLQPTRPDWYDRTPTAVPQVYEQTTGAPSVGRTNWTYTVPSGRKAWLAAVYVSYSCVGAPTFGNIARSEIVVNVGSSDVILARAMVYTSVPGERDCVVNQSGWMMPSGTTLKGGDVSLATGGSWEICQSAIITEFDR